MRLKSRSRKAALLLVACMAITAFAGCNSSKNDAESVSVYLWSNALYTNGYAAYIQQQCPDVNIEFVVGQNDLDFYKYMNERGALPDVITTRRFSLHDAAELNDQLMDLSSTELSGAVYDSYRNNFKNADGTVNWLPLCGEGDGLVANRDLFTQYGVAMPTDYASFVSACRQFDAIAQEQSLDLRGFMGDFKYDYTCLGILQGLSIPELTSLDGLTWRTSYEDPQGDAAVGLDETVWPAVFENMEQFIDDVGIRESDLSTSYSTITSKFQQGKVAIIRAGCASAVAFQSLNDIDAVFLPYFGKNGEEWLLTYPAFQVALNKDLEKNRDRKKQALKVLTAMLSNDAQLIVSGGSDVVSYSENVNLQMSSVLNNLNSCIESNHLYIRIASNDFFSASQTVVSKMIKKEYTAEEAYDAFDAILKQEKTVDTNTVLTLDRSYSNRFDKNGGNAAFSLMANTLRQYFGSDVLVCGATGFTGMAVQGDYNEKMAGYMIMPNALDAYHSTDKETKERKPVTVSMLKYVLNLFLSTAFSGYKPFNNPSLPVVSGISIEVERTEDGYALKRVLRNGVELQDDETLTLTVLSPAAFMGRFLSESATDTDKEFGFVKSGDRVVNLWKAYLKGEGLLPDGKKIAQPEKYIKIV
ncbi:MAG: ABC transporter substrate-binding protein [Candidatus Gallimonas sp.]